MRLYYGQHIYLLYVLIELVLTIPEGMNYGTQQEKKYYKQ